MSKEPLYPHVPKGRQPKISHLRETSEREQFEFIVETISEVASVSSKPLLATTNHPAAHYGQIVVLMPDNKTAIGPRDLLDGIYGPVYLGLLSVLYKPGFKPMTEDERVKARKMLWDAGYCLAVSALDDLFGCPPHY